MDCLVRGFEIVVRLNSASRFRFRKPRQCFKTLRMPLEKTSILWLITLHTVPALPHNLIVQPIPVWSLKLFELVISTHKSSNTTVLLSVVLGTYHYWLKWDFWCNIQVKPHWASAAVGLTRRPQGLDAVTDNYNFSRRKWYELVDNKYNISRFCKANKGHLYWPADSESKPFHGLQPVLIQMNFVSFQANHWTLELNFGRKNQLHHDLIATIRSKLYFLIHKLTINYIICTWNWNQIYLCAILLCLNLGNLFPFPSFFMSPLCIFLP